MDEFTQANPEQRPRALNANDGDALMRGIGGRMPDARPENNSGYGGGDLNQHVQQLERALAQCERECAMLEHELEALRRAALSDKAVMRDYIDALRGQVSEIPVLRESHQRLIRQTEELIVGTQMQSAQIATLIDTVQSSQFWKIKRKLSRMRARFRRQ